ncbi:hypothetical protein SETIT_7G022800v2 [Setaria italica]|uniref:Phosphoribulokinase/uridine kinase domain-containing protein n=1 Tax=Setaria italica TaxID=4555 RepID=A0A368RRG0_SETIT|nr:hypothetical protein SETIT_7G022800v2 [Setaria italica]
MGGATTVLPHGLPQTNNAFLSGDPPPPFSPQLVATTGAVGSTGSSTIPPRQPEHGALLHRGTIPSRRLRPPPDPRVTSRQKVHLICPMDADVRLTRRIRHDTIEKGRDIKTVLDQYSKFVKPTFEDFILPTKKYANINNE